MKIAIIGAGSVGGALGKRWAAGGHEVVFGARDPESDKTRAAVAAAGPGALAAGVREAAEHSSTSAGEVLTAARDLSRQSEALQHEMEKFLHKVRVA